MLKLIFPALLIAGSVQFFPFVHAQSSDPSWLDELRFQLEMDESCVVQYYLNIREFERPTGNSYSARVQCEDGRFIDATRTEPEPDFTFESCGKIVCQLKH